MANNCILISILLLFTSISFAESLATTSINLFINGRLANSTLTKNGYAHTIELRISAFESNYIIDLHLNNKLFSSSYVERVLTSQNESFKTKSLASEHCYYVGRVRHEADSMAAIDTCQDIKGFFSIGNTSYTITPNSKNGPSALYDIHFDSNDTTLTYMCGVKHSSRIAELIVGSGSIPRKDYFQDHLAVELFLSIGNSQYNNFTKNATAVFTNAKAIANTINVVYNSVGINIILVGSEIFAEMDPFVITKNFTDTIDNFCAYRKKNLLNLIRHDTAQLLVGENECFKDPVIGYSYTDKMCTIDSCSINCNFNENAAITGKLLAHEMGHTFGLYHDSDYVSCYCSVEKRCVMETATYVDTLAEFSTCSKDRLAQFIPKKLCLQDKPELIFQDLIFCGNGIVDAGETCDCGGFNQSCNSNCCNVTTCQLIGSVTCASGLCCDLSTCQVQPGGYVCRESNNDCDLVEFCDGDKSDCPIDTYRRNGEDCTASNTAGKCYNGTCGSRTAQCNKLWGPDSTDCIPNFYDNTFDIKGFYGYNEEGTSFGYCDILYGENLNYVPCAKSDIMCGALQCHLANNKNASSLVFTTNSFKWSTVFDIIAGNRYECYIQSYDFGAFYKHPGFVPNGAICGDAKYCVNQKCVSSAVDTTGCPNCKPNWTCNNVGNCQCINGYKEKECWESVVTTTIADPSTVETSTQPLTQFYSSTDSDSSTVKTSTKPSTQFYSSIKSTEQTSKKSDTTVGVTSTKTTIGTSKLSSVTRTSYRTASITARVTETPTFKYNPTTTAKSTSKTASRTAGVTETPTLKGYPTTAARSTSKSNDATATLVVGRTTSNNNLTTTIAEPPNNLTLIIVITSAILLPIIIVSATAAGLRLKRSKARKLIKKSPVGVFAANPVHLFQPAHTFNHADNFKMN